jgi:hypothetical protein
MYTISTLTIIFLLARAAKRRWWSGTSTQYTPVKTREGEYTGEEDSGLFEMSFKNQIHSPIYSSLPSNVFYDEKEDQD